MPSISSFFTKNWKPKKMQPLPTGKLYPEQVLHNSPNLFTTPLYTTSIRLFLTLYMCSTHMTIKNCYCNFFHTSNKVIYIAHHNVYLLVPEQLKNIFAEPDSKHNTYTHLSILISSVCFQNQSCWHRHPTSSIWWWWIESRKNGVSKIKAKKLSLVPIF